MMKTFILRTFAGAGILLCGLTANAQPQYRYDRYYGTNDDNRALWRIQSDLDRAAANTWNHEDRYRLSAAKQEVSDVRNDLSAGRVDNRELNQAIRALRQALNSSNLTMRDREILENDLSRLRSLRMQSGYRDLR